MKPKKDGGKRMGLKVLSIRELLASHTIIIAGLVLITIGLLQDVMILNIAGIWTAALGFCIVFGAVFRKLVSK